MKYRGALFFAMLAASAALLTGCVAGGSTAAPPVGSPCQVAEQALAATPRQFTTSFAANSATPFTLNGGQFGWPSIAVNMDSASVAGSVTLDVPASFPAVGGRDTFLVGARLVFSSPGNTTITFAGPPYGLVCASAPTGQIAVVGEIVDAQGVVISNGATSSNPAANNFTINRTVETTTVTTGKPYYYVILGLAAAPGSAPAPLAIDKPAISIVDSNSANV